MLNWVRFAFTVPGSGRQGLPHILKVAGSKRSMQTGASGGALSIAGATGHRQLTGLFAHQAVGADNSVTGADLVCYVGLRAVMLSIWLRGGLMVGHCWYSCRCDSPTWQCCG